MTVLIIFSYAELASGHLDDNSAFSFLGRTGLFLIGCLFFFFSFSFFFALNCRRRRTWFFFSALNCRCRQTGVFFYYYYFFPFRPKLPSSTDMVFFFFLSALNCRRRRTWFFFSLSVRPRLPFCPSEIICHYIHPMWVFKRHLTGV
jgi:hypothetical protein